MNRVARRDERSRLACSAVSRATHHRSALANQDANPGVRRGVRCRSVRQDGRGCPACSAVNRAACHPDGMATRDANRAVRRDAEKVVRPCRPALPRHQMAGGIGCLPANHLPAPGRNHRGLCGGLAAVAHVPRLRAGVNECPPAGPLPGRPVGAPDRRLTGLVKLLHLEQVAPVGRSHPAAAAAQTDSDAIRGTTVLPLLFCLVRCHRGAAFHLAAQTNLSNLTSNQPQLNSGISEYPTQS